MAKQKEAALDFAIPQMDEDLQEESISSPMPGRNEKETKLSLFWLLQHYSKENAAAYKEQRDKKKADKKEKQKKNSIIKSEENSKEKRGKRDKKGRQEPVSSGKDALRNKDIRTDRGENFGQTVIVDRDNRPGLAYAQIPPKAALECVGFGETVPLQTVPFIIGRSSQGVDLCIADNKTVGRKHAVISYRDGWYYITDLKSLNHVYLDEKQIQPETETQLHDQARIMLGNERFVFHMMDR